MDLHLRFEGVRADFVQPAEECVACAGHQQLDIAELLRSPVHEPLNGFGIGDVQRQCDGFASGGTDLVDQLLALVDASGAQRDREAAAGELDGRRSADPGRGAGDDRRPAVGQWFETGHQATFTVIGR